MAKKGNDDNEKMENPGRRVPRDAPQQATGTGSQVTDAPPPEAKTDKQRQQEAADAEKAEQVQQRDDKGSLTDSDALKRKADAEDHQLEEDRKAGAKHPQQKNNDRRQTYGIARQRDGGVFLNIGSEEVTLTEEEWLTLVAKASAGRDDGDRVPALRDFHRSEGDVGFVPK